MLLQTEVLLQVRTLLTEDSLQVKALLAGGVEALWTDELRIEVLHAEALQTEALRAEALLRAEVSLRS
ncbi:hypothetical protein [Slackia exigua]|uniref:hypothetical protein n=1 Tax=Slackia exigua TaxID=84109 RepID=UPI002109A1B6|nr:hypothetical protein [Slackia exigua]MCQ5090715.1 hypothetical protein [Slackia exigua]